MATVKIFKPGYDGDLYMEWVHSSGSYQWHKFNVRKLSRNQFKRVIRLLLNSGQWYLDYTQNYANGDWEDYGTIRAGEDKKVLPPVAVARWMWSIYR